MKIERPEVVLNTLPQLYTLFRAALPERYYYDPEDPECTLTPSVTTVIRAGSPSSSGLERWKLQKALEEGYVNAGKDYADDRAEFGTFMHIVNGRLMNQEVVNLGYLEHDYIEFLVKEGKREDDAIKKAERDSEEMKKAVLSFVQFSHDYNLKPLAVELVLKSDVAGAIDIIGQLTVPIKGYWGERLKSGPNKGEPKLTQEPVEIKAIVDMKSGSNLYPDYDLQLTGYRELIEENYPDFPEGPYRDSEGIERLERLPAAIWSPKDWRDTPSYNLSWRAPQWELWGLVKEQGLLRLKRSSDEQILNLDLEVKLGEAPEIKSETLKSRLRG